MCGIAGNLYFSDKPSLGQLKSEVELMNKLQQHRGPDFTDTFVKELNLTGYFLQTEFINLVFNERDLTLVLVSFSGLKRIGI